MTRLPVVAHLLRGYLPLSETFIYQYLTHLRRYRPIVLARRAFQPDAFPFAPTHILEQLPLPARVWNLAMFKLNGRPPLYRRVLAAERPRLLHAHFGTEGALALPLKRARGLPLVTTFYGQDMSALARQPRWQRLYAQLFAAGECFLVEGSHMGGELAALGCPSERIRISHIGVDTTRFQLRPRVVAPGEPVRLLMCGRLVEKKGVGIAIRALAQVVADYPAVQLRIVGDGPLRASLETLIADLGLRGHAQILGYLDHAGYARELEACHIFVAPSVRAADGDSEGGAPTVILEAQATGAPVLASTHADIPEVVGVKAPGFLAPEGDVDALAQRLRAMLAQPERWPEWGQIGRAHVEREYDIVRVSEQLERIYDEVTAQ